MDELTSLKTHLPCNDCGSTDALTLNTDGSTKCYSCDTFTPTNDPTYKSANQSTQQPLTFKPLEGEYSDLVKRKITERICRSYGYKVGDDNNKACHIADYRDKNGLLVGQKIRYPDKTFKCLGKVSTPFGWQKWSGARYLCVTEGEIDCLSVAEAFEGKYPVVSIPNGAAAAAACFKKHLDYFESFESVVIMFDNDEVGIQAAKTCASILSVGKAKIASMNSKDPNEALVSGDQKQIIQAFWNAEPYRPDGIVLGTDMWENISTTKVVESATYPFEGLNRITRGLRVGEIVTFCAGSGVGKSSVCRELAYHLIKSNEKVGYIALEESIKRTALGIMGIHAELPLHLLNPEEMPSEESLKASYDATIGSGNYVTYDHWGSVDSDNLINRIRYMNKALGCKWIFLDHVSIVVSGQDGDERKMIDILMTKLRSLVEETQVGMLLVSHLKRPEGRGFEEGREITLGHLRGSAGLGQLSDMVIGIERNQQDQDTKNVSTVRILKNRFSGETGVACSLTYNLSTSRMLETEPMDFE
jgi:twinkle protein